MYNATLQPKLNNSQQLLRFRIAITYKNTDTLTQLFNSITSSVIFNDFINYEQMENHLNHILI